MNAYATLADIKSPSYLNITSNSTDAGLLSLLEEASRQLDLDTGRFFYVYEGTYYQDGAATRLILDWDLQTVSTMTVDTDGDNTYESSYTIDMNSPTTAPDAFAYPTNSYPKTRLEANPWGSYGHFGAGIRHAVKIVGTFGYGDDWPLEACRLNGDKITADATSTGATLSVNNPELYSAGLTLKIDSEQMYVNASPYSGTVPVVRAVNGTTAATHTASTVLYQYHYPHAVAHAVLISAMRSFKRRESAYTNVISNPLTGDIQVWKGQDPDYRETVRRYQKTRRTWYL